MLIIDFKKLSPERTRLSLKELGMPNFNNMSLLNILKNLQLYSNIKSREHFPLFEQSGKINIETSIQRLKSSGKIIEVIGPVIYQKRIPVCFSTFLSLQPKIYLRNYIDIAKTLCTENPDLYFTVWFEDRLSVLKNDWDTEIVTKALDIYYKFFKSRISQVQFLRSTQVAPDGIPMSFAVEKFSSLKGKDFLSIMPFHLRHPNLIRVFDLVHFAWNCYILYRYSAIYLAGINTKYHFQLFRKVLGIPITVILVPLGPESFIK